MPWLTTAATMPAGCPGVQEPRAGARPRIRRVLVARMVGLGVHQRRTERGSGELAVELLDQVMVQRQFGDRGDAQTHQRQHDDLSDQQPQPQRPDPARVSQWSRPAAPGFAALAIAPSERA
ncbi:hypothetical protein O980_19145 [Mycobacterium avium subsp. paratuberculosis 08-8281]|nr:hypothetical protein O980_19145 [Mycobacterium avium subsp. paratuberculosis 08-8281]